MPPLLSPRPDGGRGVQREGGRIGVGMSARDALTAACKASNTHLHTVCLFSLNKPPMRPKVRESIVFLLSDRALLSRARSQLPCPALSRSPSSRLSHPTLDRHPSPLIRLSRLSPLSLTLPPLSSTPLSLTLYPSPSTGRSPVVRRAQAGRRPCARAPRLVCRLAKVVCGGRT